MRLNNFLKTFLIEPLQTIRRYILIGYIFQFQIKELKSKVFLVIFFIFVKFSVFVDCVERKKRVQRLFDAIKCLSAWEWEFLRKGEKSGMVRNFFA